MTSDKELSKSNQEVISADKELFVSLFEADRKRLYAYIYAYVANKTAADEIFQETSLILWRKFTEFEPGTSFSKWGNAIAFYQVKSYRHKEKKHSVGFSPILLDSLAESAPLDDNNESKWQILNDCRSDLPDHTKQLYEDFYVKNQKAQEVAEESGRSIFAIRKAIHKLRKKLFDCVGFKKHESDK
jgi:RNA polymerase sigma-70 factor (ECF subfamily)